MGKWLASLRTWAKNSENAPDVNSQNPQNLSQDSFGGFGGDPSGRLQNFYDEEDWQVEFDERAAILEYDEGLSRLEAEALAASQVAAQRRWVTPMSTNKPGTDGTRVEQAGTPGASQSLAPLRPVDLLSLRKRRTG